MKSGSFLKLGKADVIVYKYTQSSKKGEAMNWLFIDMDSYFASVEQSLRPELRGRPVGVIPIETDSTCVIAANYDAKQCGVKVGTGVRDARRLCPGIALVKARPKLYVEVHHRILASVDECAPIHRVYSIDEWAIRLRGEDQKPQQAQAFACRIKEKILKDFGPELSCSAGIATSRLLAKIASDLEKPNGLTVLPTSDLPARLEHLSLKKLCGISDGMLARLTHYGIQNIRDLWEATREQAVQIWGSVSGAAWWAGFHGIDEPEAPTRRRSMSHGNVLEPRFRNEEGARGILIRLICKLGQRLRRDGYCARSLGISIMDERGRHFLERIALPCANDTSTLLQRFHKLWEQRPPSMTVIKKVDVSVGSLILESQVTRSLFDESKKLDQVSRVVDRINLRCGPLSIYFGPVHAYRQTMENKIAFGRIPDEAD